MDKSVIATRQKIIAAYRRLPDRELIPEIDRIIKSLLDESNANLNALIEACHPFANLASEVVTNRKLLGTFDEEDLLLLRAAIQKCKTTSNPIENQ